MSRTFWIISLCDYLTTEAEAEARPARLHAFVPGHG